MKNRNLLKAKTALPQVMGFTGGNNAPAMQDAGDGFMNIPDGIDEELPFN